MSEERSRGGSRIFRHEEPDRPSEPAVRDPELIEGLSEHVARHLGEARLFEENPADLVQIDLLHAPPTDELPFHTIMTCGMSARPMSPPPEFAEHRFAELMLRLPPEWPVTPPHESEAGWPLHLLEFLGHLPHDYETWFGYTHTIPHGDPPEPYAPGTELCGVILLPPVLGPEGFDTVEVAGREIDLLAVIPLHADEMELKLDKGADRLMDVFDDAGVSELLEPRRPSVAGRRRGFFGRMGRR